MDAARPRWKTYEDERFSFLLFFLVFLPLHLSCCA